MLCFLVPCLFYLQFHKVCKLFYYILLWHLLHSMIFLISEDGLFLIISKSPISFEIFTIWFYNFKFKWSVLLFINEMIAMTTIINIAIIIRSMWLFFFPNSKLSIDVLLSLHISFRVVISGRFLPFSHFDTACGVTLYFWANFSWVKFNFFLILLLICLLFLRP